MRSTGTSFLITGSTDGIGRHTARLLYRSGATVYIHGRSSSRVEQTIEELTADHESSDRSPPIGFVADLSSFSDVRRFAQDLRRRMETPLTGLINNAGVYLPQRTTTTDGFETTWQVNVASPFLLTSLLLSEDLVKEKIVNVASISAAYSIDLNNTQHEIGYSAHGAYSLSKLANIVFSNALASRLAASGSSITSNALDPGTVNTKMLLEGWGPIGISVENANDQFFVATEVQGSGKYFVSRQERRPPPPAMDPLVQDALWDMLCEQTDARWPF